MIRPAISLLVLFLAIGAPPFIHAQNPPQPAASKLSKQSLADKQPTPEEELQQTINIAANDRAALVRNLEAYLQKYPQSPQRPQIYRALVEATLQLQDAPRAANYAERLVALKPDDMSITLLAIQLIERTGDEAGLRRSVNYATRVLDYVDRSSPDEKSPKISLEEWQTEKKRDRMSVLLLRGRIRLKLKDLAGAQQDFDAAYTLIPNAAAAEKMGEIAELNKDLNQAIAQYARAFALADGASNSVSRREIRQNLGNVWRLAHGSSDGLGEYLLRTYDEVALSSSVKHEKKNAAAHEAFEFTLRKAPDGAAFPLAQTKGKVLVVSFWATWCGPCRAQEPFYERVAARYQGHADVFFLAANCDDDETLVGPYLQEEKMRTTVVFADGLESLFGVNSYPTVLVIDRAGKIAYRSEGFDEGSFEPHLAAAVDQALNPSAAVPSTAASSAP